MALPTVLVTSAGTTSINTLQNSGQNTMANSHPFALASDQSALPVDLGLGFSASGLTPVTGTFTGTGQSASFTPLAGRRFNVSTRGTFVATFQIERSFDSGSNWHPLTDSGVWNVPQSGQLREDQFDVPYRLNCIVFTSGTIYYRISQ